MSRCLAAALICLHAAGAGAADFAEQCRELQRSARVSASYEDLPVALDESLNVAGLNKLAGKEAGGNHSVFGITQAKPYFRVASIPQAIADGRGGFCAVPEITIELGFTQMAVYLATELTNPCQRAAIRDHEQEHVDTWKSHLRASAQLITTTLRREIGEARFYASRDETQAGVRAWTQELVAPLAQRVVASVSEAQRTLDTPASYAAVSSRLRACPRTAR